MEKWEEDFKDELILKQNSYYIFTKCYMGELLNRISSRKAKTKVRIKIRKGAISIERIK